MMRGFVLRCSVNLLKLFKMFVQSLSSTIMAKTNRRFNYAYIDNPLYVVMLITLLPILLPFILMAAIVAPLCSHKQKPVQPPFNRRF